MRKYERNQNGGTKVKVEEWINKTKHGTGRYQSRNGKIREWKGCLGLRFKLIGTKRKLQKVTHCPPGSYGQCHGHAEHHGLQSEEMVEVDCTSPEEVHTGREVSKQLHPAKPQRPNRLP